ncbi:hypothetical protein BGX34_007061, partial [Mortierella sp. NVP85]
MLGFVLAVPYDRKIFLVDKVVKATLSTFPSVTQLDHYRPGVVYIQFKTEEERTRALTMEIPCSPSPLRTKPIVFSTGRRITIRVEHSQISDPGHRAEAIEKLFGAYGKVVHTTYHYWKGTDEALMPSFDFVLEVPGSTSKDLKLPRVANILGTNHLFSWSGAPFCFKCGKDDHTKQNCPRSANYSLIDDDPVDTTIMARAFPDPTILRPPTTLSPQAPSTVSTKTNKTSVKPTALKPTEPAWTTVQK